MSELLIRPLGGLGEIGMNCLCLSYEKDLILIDCGVQFCDLDNFGVDFFIPNFSSISDFNKKISGILITHGHEDHIGGLPYLIKNGFKAPIYATAFTSLLVEARLREAGVLDQVEIRLLRPHEKIELGEFKITPVPVNHSIVEASALFIDLPIGRVIHTGDFKIDPSPHVGKTMEMAEFQKAGDDGVLLLLSDSTNVEREDDSGSDREVFDKLSELMPTTKGLTIFSLFSSNIARMSQIVEIAKKLNKKVLPAGRSVESNLRFAMECGYLPEARDVLVGPDEIDLLEKKELVVIATGSQGEYKSALSRISQGEHKKIKIDENDTVVLSSSQIPGNERAIGRTINRLFERGADVIYQKIHKVHVTGHASKPELKRMLNAVKPRFFIPIHGEYRHLVLHGRLAVECGVKEKNVVVAKNGDQISVTPGHIQVLQRGEEDKIMVGSQRREFIEKELLKKRRKIAEGGLVWVVIAQEKVSLELIGAPEIHLIGLVNEEREEALLTGAREVVQKVVEGLTEDDLGDVGEIVRLALRRYFYRILERKPPVVPVVMKV